MAAALVMLPISHVVLSIRPIDAEASAPKCPTIAASMKNMSTLVICANIDGMLRLTMSCSFSVIVICAPLRMLASKASVLFIDCMRACCAYCLYKYVVLTYFHAKLLLFFHPPIIFVLKTVVFAFALLCR